MLAFNFFFLPPVHTFTIAAPENIVALFFFLLVAVIASNLTARVRSQAIVARQRAKTTEDLYLFSRKLTSVGTLDDLLWATSFQIASMLKVRVVILMPERGKLEMKSGYPPEDELDEADLGAAKWAYEHDRETGRGSDTLPGARRLFIPMRTGRGTVGVIGIDSDQPGSEPHAGTAAPASFAVRSGRPRGRADPSGRGRRPRTPRGRVRPASLGASHLDLS